VILKCCKKVGIKFPPTIGQFLKMTQYEIKNITFVNLQLVHKIGM
jgi:hypothetical protein